MPLDCIVFDIDDTLYLERDYVRSGFHCVDHFIRQRYGIEAFFDRAWAYFEAGRRGNIFDTTLEDFGITPTDELLQNMVSKYRNHEPDIKLLADSELCLSSIHGKRLCGIISDGAVRGQTLKIERLGLSARIDHIILTDSFGVEFRKPHERAFLEMQALANCPARHCMYVADNPAKDFVAPRRLGWQTVRVRRNGGIYTSLTASPDSEPDIEIENLLTLWHLLGENPTKNGING